MFIKVLFATQIVILMAANNSIEQWANLARSGIAVLGLEYYTIDRNFVFDYFYKQAQKRNVALYYWNLGYLAIQKVVSKNKQIYSFSSTELIPPNSDVLQCLLASKNNGIFLVDDIANFKAASPHHQLRVESQIQNIIDEYKLSQSGCERTLVLLAEEFNFSNKLREVPILKYPLPNVFEVESLAEQFCQSINLIGSEISLKRLTVACQGLPRGEIELILQRYSQLGKLEKITEAILDYKVQSLRGLGLEFVSEPDVAKVGGLDLLQEYLSERVIKLNEASAVKYGLRPPRGMMLLGPPGTGKTLTAKMTAKAMGYTLLAMSLGNVMGSTNPDFNLRRILEVADAISQVVLLADDFDKGFTGWDSGGVARRLSQRLLTWMQEHTSNVLMLATCNRIKLLPAEVVRRFDDGGIWFVDLPSMGEMYEVFQVHLAKHFPAQFKGDRNPWTDRDWYRLLKAYRGSTPVEIANAVRRVANAKYCNLSTIERKQAQVNLHIEIEELQAQLEQFIKASQRDSEDLQAIRNTAYYARPASSKDESRFAIEAQELFEYKPHSLEKHSVHPKN